jgi:hypothetical protein
MQKADPLFTPPLALLLQAPPQMTRIANLVPMEVLELAAALTGMEFTTVPTTWRSRLLVISHGLALLLIR